MGFELRCKGVYELSPRSVTTYAGETAQRYLANGIMIFADPLAG